MERKIPADLQQCWDASTRSSDVIAALKASGELWLLWAKWQATLVREAVAGGATWDEIGRSVGTSRQAAWGKFKGALEGDRLMEKEKEKEKKRQIRDSIAEILAKGRERDRELAADRKRLRDELHAVDKKRVQERREREHQIAEIRSGLRRRRQTD